MAVSSDPRIGTELAGYRIEALIGRGGMGVVYRAEHLRLRRKVALKLLVPDLAQDERFRGRFLRESRIAAAIDHPNIVPIYDADEADGVLYIAMRYVEGTDLKGVLEREGCLDPVRALSFIAQVGSAIDAAHGHGLVHRDVKPGNVLLAPGDHCYLADFGLTKMVSSVSGLTATGQFIGTLDYVAPEQVKGEAVDGRADLYSLGCVLYECLTGSPPYKRDTEVAVLWAHVQEEPPLLTTERPELPPALDAVLARALAKEPGDRYQSGQELAGAAAGALEGRIPAMSRLRRRELKRPKRRLVVALGAAVAVVAASLAAVFALGGGGDGGGAEPPGQRQAPTADDPATIVAGRSIGAVRLGMSEEDVVRTLGDPPSKREWTSRGKTGSTATYTLHGAPFRVSYFQGEVVMVTTRSPYYETEGGIRFGLRAPDPTDVDQRKQALRTGELLQVGKDRYSWRGFVFDGGVAYCASGDGGTTVLATRASGEIRIVDRGFIPDQPAMAFELAAAPLAPCENAL